MNQVSSLSSLGEFDRSFPHGFSGNLFLWHGRESDFDLFREYENATSYMGLLSIAVSFDGTRGPCVNEAEQGSVPESASGITRFFRDVPFGSCAFALDKTRRKFHVARGSDAHRTLQYVSTRSGTVVSTNPQVLSELDRLGDYRREHLRKYLLDSLEDEAQDFFQALYRVRPGEEVIFDTTGYVLEKCDFRDWNSIEERNFESDERLACRLVEKASAFLSNFEPKKPVYSLSGGLDSNFLVGVADQSGNGNRTRAASTLDLTNQEIDEKKSIEKIVKRLDLKHRYFSRSQHLPFESFDGFQYSDALGPPFSASTSWSTPFYRFIRRTFDTNLIVTGVGGDLLWQLTGHEAIAASLRRGNLRALIDAVCNFGLHWPLRDFLKWRLARTVGNDTYQHLVSWVRTELGPDDGIGRDVPERWVRPRREKAATGASASSLSRRFEPHGRKVSGFLRNWFTESLSRKDFEFNRDVEIRRLHPYLAEPLVRLYFQAGPIACYNQKSNRRPVRIALSGIAPELAWSESPFSARDGLIWRGLFNNARSFIDSLQNTSRLGDLNLIDPTEFVSTFNKVERLHHVYPNFSLPVRPFMRTLLAELWLRYRGE